MGYYCNEIFYLIVLLDSIYECVLLRTLSAELTPKQFTSHSNYGTENYPNNYTGEWLLKSTGENRTIVTSLLECEIEAVNKKGQTLCSWEWDLLVFYNVNITGNTTEYLYIESTCCNGTLGNISSTGPELFIRFTTDDSTPKRGFRISYESIESPSNNTQSQLQGIRANVQETGSNTTAVAGGVVGALVSVAVVILIILLLRHVVKKRDKAKIMASG
ncbi:tolloid-like protein 1 [Saccostrea cucullata]|uniref:tolloid-like protein 1 n=1 Tax=Saccostrea cuccullata TaxID=36930 RepID=UPI002ED00201